MVSSLLYVGLTDHIVNIKPQARMCNIGVWSRYTVIK